MENLLFWERSSFFKLFQHFLCPGITHVAQVVKGCPGELSITKGSKVRIQEREKIFFHEIYLKIASGCPEFITR
jgi:hypothetical protein